ncbi:MAG TPA: hypothetical protein VFJ58_03285 [Armatimonadota bacterium]|nr:hypothetical protein [Armatimonadota bacterium]
MLEERVLDGAAIDHIRRTLSYGKRLSNHLLTLPLESGSVIALLPSTVEEDAVLDFERGGRGDLELSAPSPSSGRGGMYPKMTGDLEGVLPRAYQLAAVHLTSGGDNCVIL